MRAHFLLAVLVPFFSAAAAHAQTVLFSDDFESGTSQWALTTNWRLAGPTDPCATALGPFPSGTHCLRFGSASVCDFDVLPWAGTATMVSPITLPTTASSIELSFQTRSSGEDLVDGEWDARRVRIWSDANPMWVKLSEIHSSLWYRHVYDLSSFAGQTVQVRFDFDAVDGWVNNGDGWLVDDVAIRARAEPGVPFCFGDWCPCSNVGASGNGCATSINPAGGNLTSSGSASVSSDNVVLTSTGLSNSVVTFFQGTSTVFDGLYGASAFGDGRRCVSGSVVRLKAVPTVGGTAQFPGPGDPSVSVRGGVLPAGGNRSYQVWYRNAANFCTASTFNVTNGLLVNWRP